VALRGGDRGRGRRGAGREGKDVDSDAKWLLRGVRSNQSNPPRYGPDD